MTERRHLTVIPGGKIASKHRTPCFTGAEATDTRLMGVVGVRAIEELPEGIQVVHFFHLDFEDYGIDGYERLDNPQPDEVEQITQKMMGGLGGSFVSIDSEEAAWLIREAYSLNLSHQEDLPDGMEGLFHFLRTESGFENKEIINLWRKITPEIENDFELIHYFMMRVCAGDSSAVHYLMNTGAHSPKLLDKNAVLVRNRVQFLREVGGVRYYQSEVLSDNSIHYWVCACEVGVFEEAGRSKVFNVSVQSSFRVSEVEASFMLRRKEYLAIYKIRDLDRVKLYFDLYKMGSLINLHEEGVLYTFFKTDNTHVQNEMYYLNDDVQAFYYLSESEQLVVCALEKGLVEKAIEELDHPDMRSLLRFESYYEAPNPMFYDFVQSDYLDFHEYWEDYNE